MANAQPTFNVTIKEATTQKITNLDLILQNTEYSHTLTNGVKKLMIRSRSKGEIKFTLTQNESGSNYITINAGAVYFIDNISLNLSVMYMQSSQANNIIEIEEWY